MKRVVLGFLAYLMAVTTYGQGIGINETNASPAASAILDVSSTDKGFLTPRMTTAQRYAINSPADGLLVFDTDENCFAVYKMSAWYLLCGTIDPGSVKTLSIVSGNGQSACGSSALGSPVLVGLVDGNGTPIVGTTLNFAVTAGGGTVSVATAVTDASGQAQVNWTLGASGVQTMEISGTGITTQVATATAENLIVSTGTMTDARDGQTYTTVTYCNGQTWMSQNLSYDVPSVYTGGGVVDTMLIALYGRSYDWATMMNGASSSNASPSGVQGICPSGWHVPSDEEWKTLEKVLGMAQIHADGTGWRGNQGYPLKSTSGWAGTGNGSNVSGFDAVPAGYFTTGYAWTSHATWFWSSTENTSSDAWTRTLDYRFSSVSRWYHAKTYGFSCRCVED